MNDAANEGDTLNALRDTLLAATLPHIPFDGWSERALARGAADAGYDTATAGRAFPLGAADMIEHHSGLADRRMLAALEEMDVSALRVRDRVSAAVRLRLQQNEGDREAIRRALSFLAQPQHAALWLKCLYRTVNAIWYAAGDTATVFNFYTKRALLAGVYAATLVYWLQDDSEGAATSWAVLDRRIGEVMRVPRAMARVRAAAGRLPNPLKFMDAAGRRFG